MTKYVSKFMKPMHITIKTNVCVSDSKRTLDIDMLCVVKVLAKSAANKSVFGIKDITHFNVKYLLFNRKNE